MNCQSQKTARPKHVDANCPSQDPPVLTKEQIAFARVLGQLLAMRWAAAHPVAIHTTQDCPAAGQEPSTSNQSQLSDEP